MFEENRNMLISLNDPKSPVSEAYRVLRTNIQFSSIDKPIRSMVVTSAGPGEGKTATICNTAVTFAQSGSKVLVIDADLRKPKVHKLFNINNRKGITNILALHEDYHEHVHSSPASNLDVLLCGAIPPNPSELLSSQSMRELLVQILDEYEYVFIDAPPVGVVTDAAILSTIVDATIIVAGYGHVETEALQQAKEHLEKVNANIIGVVLNRISRSARGNCYYYYYQDDGNKRRKRKPEKVES